MTVKYRNGERIGWCGGGIRDDVCTPPASWAAGTRMMLAPRTQNGITELARSPDGSLVGWAQFLYLKGAYWSQHMASRGLASLRSSSSLQCSYENLLHAGHRGPRAHRSVYSIEKKKKKILKKTLSERTIAFFALPFVYHAHFTVIIFGIIIFSDEVNRVENIKGSTRICIVCVVYWYVYALFL